MRIDCHTHAFSEKIASKAVEQLINYYNLPTKQNGTLSEIIMRGQEADLDALVLLVAATRADQVRPAHDWIFSKVLSRKPNPKQPQLIPFGTYHPDDLNWLDEIQRLRKAKIRGIKLHPEFQGIDLADPRLLPFFEEISRDFILMVHIGDPRITSNNLSTPRKVAEIARQFPKLQIIAAHMGGYCMWEAAYQELAGAPVYMDTSSTLGYIDPELFKRIVKRHGIERILFGSDYPLRTSQEDLINLDKISWLTPSEKQLIIGDNTAALLGLM